MTWRAILTTILSVFAGRRATTDQLPAADPKEAQRAYWRAASKRHRAKRKGAKAVNDRVKDIVNDASLTVNDAPNREVGLKKRERAPPSGNALPKDFKPDAESLQLATELHGGNAHAKIASFCDWAWATGTTRPDWQAQLRWWLRHEAKQLLLKRLCRDCARSWVS
jgi:hypothetical protein